LLGVLKRPASSVIKDMNLVLRAPRLQTPRILDALCVLLKRYDEYDVRTIRTILVCIASYRSDVARKRLAGLMNDKTLPIS